MFQPNQKVLNFDKFQNIILEVKNNSITEVYSLNKQEKLNLFNSEKISFSKDNYKIGVLNNSKMTYLLRS